MSRPPPMTLNLNLNIPTPRDGKDRVGAGDQGVGAVVEAAKAARAETVVVKGADAVADAVADAAVRNLHPRTRDHSHRVMVFHLHRKARKRNHLLRLVLLLRHHRLVSHLPHHCPLRR